jgi:GT2 family glycosyltransferase
MGTPLISIVIVTWNRKEDILEAIQSIYDQDYRNFEVIVVDNNSTDGTVEALSRAYPAVRLVALDQNMGASGGRNAGIAVARGEIIFILDSDAALDKDTLSKIVHKFQIKPEVGVISCKFLNTHTGELDPYTWHCTESAKADQDLEFPCYQFSECGSAIRKEVLDQAGLFWDLLFFDREGEELSLRIWDAGYEVLYWPEVIVYHRASPEMRVAGCERLYFDLRNSLYIYLARYPWWMLACFVPLKMGTSLVKGARKGCLRQILQALLKVIRQLPTLWQQRRPISNKTARLYLKLQRDRGPLAWDLASWLKYKA